MSAPRPQSSRGRGRGHAGGQSVNNNARRDQSPQDNNNVSPAGVNRQRQKKPEVQRYVPRGRRLLNQQEEGTRAEQVDLTESSTGDNFATLKEDSDRNRTESLPEQCPSRSDRKRAKNEIYVPPGRRSVEDPESLGKSSSDKEGRQFEDVHAGATESEQSFDLKPTDEGSRDGKESSVEIEKGTTNSGAEEEQSGNDFVCDNMKSEMKEEEGMEVCEEFVVNNDHVELNVKEKVENTSESEKTCLPVESNDTAGVMESEFRIGEENEDDTPLNWDDDVEEGSENVASNEMEDVESKLKGKDSITTVGKVQASEVNESKSEIKKIKLKKKKKSKALNEGKTEEETGTAEKKGKKKSSRSNITVFDMMNMNELREDKSEDKKMEAKEELVPERKVGETVPKGDNFDKDVEEDDSWDKMFDDDGECVDPSAMDELTKTVGKVKIEKATINYLDFKPKEPDYDEMNHVIEIFDFPAEFKTEDLLSIFSQFKNKGFDIKWVDDTHALGVFSSAVAAQDALKTNHPLCKVGPLSDASKACKEKAKRCVESLQPYKPRPETTAMTARRLVTGALGIAPKVSKEQRELERQKLKEAKEKKRSDRKQRDDIWEGTVVSKAS